MKKKKRNGALTIFLILTILFAVLALCLILQYYFKHIPDNASGTIGNTAGNLNNKGLFCESDGKVYFANAYDNYALYSMNPDETDMKMLSSSSVESINAGGNYLYYYQTNAASGSSFSFMSRFSGVYRIRKDGSDAKCLDRCLSGIVSLAGNSLYYQHFDNHNTKGTTLFQINTDKSGKREAEEYLINPASVSNELIYFSGTRDDHYLYTLDTRTDAVSTLWEGNLCNPVASDGYVYYMDIPNNYRLCRFSLTDGSTQVLTEDRIDFYNVYPPYIYYQKSDAESPALKRITTEGENEEIIKEGVFDKINITSNYVYFSEFDKPTPVYKTGTNGAVNVTVFQNALEAAEAEAP